MVVMPRKIPVSRATKKPAEGRKPNFRGRVRGLPLGRRRRAAVALHARPASRDRGVVDQLVDPSVTVPAITGRAASWGDPHGSARTGRWGMFGSLIRGTFALVLCRG